MATNIVVLSIKQIEPISAPASARIDFTVTGFLPNIVQIYASGASGGVGNLVSEVDMSPPETTYNQLISLPAAMVLFIHFCPRVRRDDGELDDEINGQAWEASCTVSQFTTQAPPLQPRPKPPTPTLTSIEPRQATLHDEARIDVHWVGIPQFDLYHFMWREQPHGWQEIEINSGGDTGFWTVQQAAAGRTYSFKVQGCISRTIGNDDCSLFSDQKEVLMISNTHSLRTFLKLSDVQANTGIRSLGEAALREGVRSMMRL